MVRNENHLATSLDASRKCITLLENKGILPLKKGDKRKIFITGPNADNMTTLGDWVSPQPEANFITIKEGIEALAPENNFLVEFFDCGQRSRQIKTGDITKAAELAKEADINILVLGENSFRHDWPNKTTGENIDRSTLQLSGRQLELAMEVKKSGKPLIVIFVNGSPISEEWITQNADAVIEAWEPGDFGGQAVAEVLFGKINPSGKCPMTIPRSVGQLQMVYNHKPSTYKHKYYNEPKTPRYPFGYGLSYTTYKYDNLKIEGDLTKPGDQIMVSFDVTNTGKMDGEEICQLYIHDVISTITRPVMELKGYQRVFLKSGEKKNVKLTLSPEHLAYYNAAYDFVVEKGEFEIMVGGSSDVKKLLQTKIQIQDNLYINQ